MSAQYKQAILVGAAPIGKESAQLLSLLKWAGYEKTEVVEQSEDDDCSHNCGSCAKACQSRQIQKDVLLIAADGGIKFLYENNMVPDYWVGDLDSFVDQSAWPEDLLALMEDIPHEKVAVEKDDTDMALAAAIAYERGYEDMLIYGGLGGARLSHTLANIQLLQFYAKKNCNIRMMGEGIRLEILRAGIKAFSAAVKGHISVICLSDTAKDVKIKGLKYEYEGDLTSDVALGVSNSFVGKDASISVGEGTLLLMIESVG